MKKQLMWLVIFGLVAGIVMADTENFDAAKKIIDAKTPCQKLSEAQLEQVGDYFMEQMHPGKTHEAMDQMMGGEGSESLRLMHIAIAKTAYCNDLNNSDYYGSLGMMRYGMMGSIGGRTNLGVTNMMGRSYTNYGMMGYGGAPMMGWGYGYWSIFDVLYVILLVGLIIVVYLWAWKLWKKGGKKWEGSKLNSGRKWA